LEKGRQGCIEEKIGGDKISPTCKVTIEISKGIVQCPCLGLDLAEVSLGLHKVVQQGIEGTGMPQLVLRHGRSRHRRLQCWRTVTPVGVTPPDSLFVIGQRREHGKQRRVIYTSCRSTHVTPLFRTRRGGSGGCGGWGRLRRPRPPLPCLLHSRAAQGPHPRIPTAPAPTEYRFLPQVSIT